MAFNPFQAKGSLPIPCDDIPCYGNKTFPDGECSMACGVRNKLMESNAQRRSQIARDIDVRTFQPEPYSPPIVKRMQLVKQKFPQRYCLPMLIRQTGVSLRQRFHSLREGPIELTKAATGLRRGSREGPHGCIGAPQPLLELTYYQGLMQLMPLSLLAVLKQPHTVLKVPLIVEDPCRRNCE